MVEKGIREGQIKDIPCLKIHIDMSTGPDPLFCLSYRLFGDVNGNEPRFGAVSGQEDRLRPCSAPRLHDFRSRLIPGVMVQQVYQDIGLVLKPLFLPVRIAVNVAFIYHLISSLQVVARLAKSPAWIFCDPIIVN